MAVPFRVESHNPSLSLYAEEYADNQGISGVRKRSGGFEDDSNDYIYDDDDDDESIELGSEDTDETESMSGKAKQSTPGKTSAIAPFAVPPSAANPRVTIDEELAALRFDKMIITNKFAERGHNFNCPYPHIWWSYVLDGIKHVKYEFLIWTCHEEEVVPKISSCGNFLYFSAKIPERFLNIQRQKGLYTAAGIDLPESGDIMLETGKQHFASIKDALGNEDIKPPIKISLPFCVQETFFDPYYPTSKGYGLRSYVHEKATTQTPRVFYVFYVCMQDKARIREKARADFSAITMTDEEFDDI